MAIKHKVQVKDGVFEYRLTAMKAIRMRCLDCSNWQQGEVKNCPLYTCALWPFRMGRNPKPNELIIPEGE